MVVWRGRNGERLRRGADAALNILVRIKRLHSFHPETKDVDLMDFSDVRHSIAFSHLEVRHIIDLSPSVVSITRELRYSIIAAVIGFTAASIVKSVLNSKRPPQA